MKTAQLSRILFFTVCMVFQLFLSTIAIAIGNIEISGKINRDASVGQFDLTIFVPESPIGITPTGTETDVTKDRLKIYIPKASSNDTIVYEGNRPTASLPYSFTKITDASETLVSSTQKNITFKIRIRNTDTSTKPLSSLLESDTNGSYVLLKLKYFENGVALNETPVEKKIYVSSAIIKSSPTGLALKPTHQTIKMEWAASNTAKYNDDTDGSISKVVFVAIAEDATQTNLPAKSWSPEKTVDNDAEEDACSFDKTAQTVSCIDSSKNYLDTEALKNLTSHGIYVKENTSNYGTDSFTQLENGKLYYIFAYYEPGGLERTSVLSASPVENKTGAEIAGEGDAKWETPRCFIATAAYGSPLHKNLKLFTWFRDHVLLNYSWGKSFVEWYYQKGPHAAKIVAQYPTLAFAVRGALWVPAILIGSWLTINEYPAPYLWAGFTMFLAFGVFFTNYCLRRSRQE
jgi:hypothetical protein